MRSKNFMKKIIVLGAGQVGRTIAEDLAADYEVGSADISSDNLRLLKTSVRGINADLSDPNSIKKIISGTDLVVGAVPGFMGYQMARTVIGEGKDLVDISFFNEDIFSLHDDALKKD